MEVSILSIWYFYKIIMSKKKLIKQIILFAYILFVFPIVLLMIVFSFDAPSSTSNPLVYICDGLLLFAYFYVLKRINKKD